MTLTDWQKIFSLSVINGNENFQHLLPVNGWEFPKQTWLQKRLDEIRKEQGRNEPQNPSSRS